MTSAYGVAVMHLGLSASAYGALISLNGALIVACELPLTIVTRRFPPLNVMAFGYLMVGLGFGLNAFAGGPLALAACVVVFTFGEIAPCPFPPPPWLNSLPATCGGTTWAPTA